MCKVQLEPKLMMVCDVRKLRRHNIRSIDNKWVDIIHKSRKWSGYKGFAKVGIVEEAGNEGFLFGAQHLIKGLSDNEKIWVDMWKVGTFEELEELALGSNINKPTTRVDLARAIEKKLNKGISKEDVCEYFGITMNILDNHLLLNELPSDYHDLVHQSENASRATKEHPLTYTCIREISKKCNGLRSDNAKKILDVIKKHSEDKREKDAMYYRDALRIINISDDHKIEPSEAYIWWKREQSATQSEIIRDIYSYEKLKQYPIILSELRINPSEIYDVAEQLLYKYNQEKLNSTTLSCEEIFPNAKIKLIGNQIQKTLENFINFKPNIELLPSSKGGRDWDKFLHELEYNESITLFTWDQIGWSIHPNQIEIFLTQRPNGIILLTILNPFREDRHSYAQLYPGLNTIFGKSSIGMNTFEKYLYEYQRILKDKGFNSEIELQNEKLCLMKIFI